MERVTAAERRSAGAEEYAELSRRVRERGLMERQPAYYARKMLTTAAMLAASAWILLAVDNPWLQLLNAVFMAFAFGQVGYIGHDAGHLGIFRSSRANRLAGYAASTLMGVSSSWWMTVHGQHHREPNNLDEDPHTMIPVLAFSAERAERLGGLLRRAAAYQAFYFIPLLTLEALGMRLASARFLLAGWRSRDGVLEASLLGLHAAAYGGLVLYALGPLEGLAFAAVHQAAFGVYYGMAFAPNHKGMLELDPDSPLDFVRAQVLTTRNVRPGRVVDLLYGGLNYQIEHHLFTMMPRNRLGRARPIVREFCRERGIPYHETGVFRSYAEILGHLHRVTAGLRGRPPAAAAGTAGG